MLHEFFFLAQYVFEGQRCHIDTSIGVFLSSSLNGMDFNWFRCFISTGDFTIIRDDLISNQQPNEKGEDENQQQFYRFSNFKESSVCNDDDGQWQSMCVCVCDSVSIACILEASNECICHFVHSFTPQKHVYMAKLMIDS